MASEADASSPLKTPLGLLMLCVFATGWLVAGIIAVLEAPLAVGAACGFGVLFVALFWGWQR